MKNAIPITITVPYEHLKSLRREAAARPRVGRRDPGPGVIIRELIADHEKRKARAVPLAASGARTKRRGGKKGAAE